MFNPFRKTYSKVEEEMFAFLAMNHLFSGLTKKEITLFLPYLHLRKYRKGEIVFFRNDPNQALYIMKEGLVELQLDIDDHFETIARIGKYFSFGNNSLLGKGKRNYTAVVNSKTCELYVLPQVNILNIFEDKRNTKAKMLQALCEIFNNNSKSLLEAYQATHGFFDLKEMYNYLEYGE